MYLESNIDQIKKVVPKRHTGSSLSIHPYFGKVDPALAGSLIEQLSNNDAAILDPFCGSGTVLHEALTRGRTVTGWDSSELAGLICSAKLLGINKNEKDKLVNVAESILEEVAKIGEIDLQHFSSHIPQIKRVLNLEKWFTKNALKELAFLKSRLAAYKSTLDQASSILLDVAFSRIIVQASNQKGESSYTSVKKPDHEGRVIDLFLKSLKSTIQSAEKFNDELSAKNIKRENVTSSLDETVIGYGQEKVTIKKFDSRFFESAQIAKPADLVVSSPPYLMSWDYGLYHKFRFYWMGFDLCEYEETEIGRHLRRKKDDVERYTSDMTNVFRSLDRVMNKNASIALINAPSVVYGKLVDTNALLGDCASEAGWKLTEQIESIDIPGPHHGMYKSLKPRNAKAPGEAGKKEHVLIFRRN